MTRLGGWLIGCSIAIAVWVLIFKLRIPRWLASAWERLLEQR